MPTLAVQEQQHLRCYQPLSDEQGDGALRMQQPNHGRYISSPPQQLNAAPQQPNVAPQTTAPAISAPSGGHSPAREVAAQPPTFVVPTAPRSSTTEAVIVGAAAALGTLATGGGGGSLIALGTGTMVAGPPGWIAAGVTLGAGVVLGGVAGIYALIARIRRQHIHQADITPELTAYLDQTRERIRLATTVDEVATTMIGLNRSADALNETAPYVDQTRLNDVLAAGQLKRRELTEAASGYKHHPDLEKLRRAAREVIRLSAIQFSETSNPAADGLGNEIGRLQNLRDGLPASGCAPVVDDYNDHLALLHRRYAVVAEVERWVKRKTDFIAVIGKKNVAEIQGERWAVETQPCGPERMIHQLLQSEYIAQLWFFEAVAEIKAYEDRLEGLVHPDEKIASLQNRLSRKMELLERFAASASAVEYMRKHLQKLPAQISVITNTAALDAEKIRSSRLSQQLHAPPDQLGELRANIAPRQLTGPRRFRKLLEWLQPNWHALSQIPQQNDLDTFVETAGNHLELTAGATRLLCAAIWQHRESWANFLHELEELGETHCL